MMMMMMMMMVLRGYARDETAATRAAGVRGIARRPTPTMGRMIRLVVTLALACAPTLGRGAWRTWRDDADDADAGDGRPTTDDARGRRRRHVGRGRVRRVTRGGFGRG